MKVGITLDDKLMHRIDEYADSHYMSRSGLIALAATQFLNAEDVMDAVKNLSYAMRKIADTGKIDDETQEKLEDFERIAKFLTSQK